MQSVRLQEITTDAWTLCMWYRNRQYKSTELKIANEVKENERQLFPLSPKEMNKRRWICTRSNLILN